MNRQCEFKIKEIVFIIDLKNTKSADIVWQNLPLRSTLNTWGQELYFFVNFTCPLEKGAKEVINLGEIVFWPKGKCIAIGFGKTPASIKDEIRLADKCNIWGETNFNLKILQNIAPGEEILIEKKS